MGQVALKEADTCCTLITTKIQTAGWENEPHFIGEEHTFTDGLILVCGNQYARKFHLLCC
jgi:type I restriction enzyme R subunit